MVRTCVTTHGPALSTVTGTARVSTKIWVIPTFSPTIPLISGMVSLELDLDVDPGRQVQALELLDRLGGRVDDVDQPLMREHLEVLARVLVLVRRADHRVDVPLGRQRHRPDHLRACALDVLDDVARGDVEHPVVVRPELDPDLRTWHERAVLTRWVT